MIERVCVVTAVVVACGSGSGAKKPDAPAPDSAIDARVDAPACARTVFLNFDGGTFTLGNDDATTNTSSIVQGSGTMTLPPYAQSNVAQAAIFDQVHATLAPYSVTVVMTRPAAPGYHMVMIGGHSTQLGLSAGIGAIGSTPLDCTTGIPKAIVFVFEDYDPTGANPAILANFAIGYYGLSKGVPLSTAAPDCMCDVATTCNGSAACSIGSAGTPRDPNSPCGTGSAFDEQAAFGAIGCD